MAGKTSPAVRHVVLANFRAEGLKESTLGPLRRALESLVGEIDGLVEVRTPVMGYKLYPQTPTLNPHPNHDLGGAHGAGDHETRESLVQLGNGVHAPGP